MILKIFPPTASFSGVKYNTNKIDRNKGELMKVANFGPLQAFGHLKPQDYINYLTALASLNKNVKLPQFHAVISAKGKNYDKIALTGIAENWLREMGFGEQPYLIVFHKDTANDHVHLVSCRVDRNGNKIDSAFEWRRGQRAMQRVLGYEFATQYRFSTRAQFFMILESQGFPGVDPDEKKIKQKMNAFVPDKTRTAELRSLLLQYPESTLLREKYGVELIFHAAEGKKPYGYSIIDHQEKIVFKGSEVLPLKDLSVSPGVDFNSMKEPAEKEITAAPVLMRPISIADDIDDQQVLGMKRRRQKKARINTR